LTSLCCIISLAVAGPALAAEALKKDLDLPADTVENSVKRLSEATGVDVLLPTNLARNVRAHPVKGLFTAREALDLMLSGTGLVAAQDEKTGALTVRRESSDPNAPRAAQSEKSDRPPRTESAATRADMSRSDVPDLVELSPFVVDRSRDRGYRATSTLAGSRINTELKDIAAPLTVVTKELMNDVSASGVNDLLPYLANTEGTRDFTASVSSLGRPTDSPASDPSGAIRIRGLARADITRDYFYTLGTSLGSEDTNRRSIDFDAYNLDTVTVSRGPNAILAGVGSPGGIINYSPQLANTSRDATEVSFRYGSYDDVRATLNSNFVLKPGVLGLRAAVLWSQAGYQQEPAWNHDTRYYLTATYRPWSSTTARVGYEKVRINANYPNALTPEDAISQWVALGRPSYDSTSTAPVSPFLTQDAGQLVAYDKNKSVIGGFNANTGYYFFQRNLSNVGIWAPLRMSDDRYGNWHTLNTNPSLDDKRLETCSFSIDQQILPGLALSLAGVREQRDNDSLNLFRTEYATYSIDVNRRTANGAPNPHYGETYMQYRGLDNKQRDHDTNRVGRATLTYELDLRKLNRWFGRYRLTSFAETRRTELEHIQYNTKRLDTAPYAYLQEIGSRYYLGGTQTAPATTVPGHPQVVSGVPNLYLDAASGTFKQDTLSDFHWLKSDAKSLTKLDSSTLVFQGYLWDDRIVGMLGLRHDSNGAAFAQVVDPNDVVPGSGMLKPLGGYPPITSASANTKTYGVVFHALKFLSLHYNYAENFIPNAGSIDLLGRPTPSPTGEGKDYGVSVRLFDDKLNAKLNWFELTAANGPAGNPANFPLAQWNLTFMDLVVEPELAKQAGITYKQGVAPGIIVGDPRLANAYTADNVSKGLEFELTYNPIPNWRIMASVARQEAKQSNIAPALTAFVQERLTYWQSIPALWTQNRTANNPWGLTQTGQEHFNQFLLGSYIGYRSVDGQPSPQIRKWHGSAVTTYGFTQGPLKNFSVGGALRYYDKAIIGNPAITDRAGNVTGLDLAHPYTTPAFVAVDAWIGYRRRILAERYTLSFQLNGRDLQESGGYRPITANSDGTHSAFRIMQPRTFYLTAKLDF